MTATNASIESVAAMRPGAVLTPPPERGRGYCAMCNSLRDLSGVEHPILGRLCVWCARAADYTLDRIGLEIRDWEVCPFCLEEGRLCGLHEQ